MQTASTKWKTDVTKLDIVMVHQFPAFLDLHFEEKIKDLFKDSEFLKLLKKGNEQIRNEASTTDLITIISYILEVSSAHSLTTSPLPSTLMG